MLGMGNLSLAQSIVPLPLVTSPNLAAVYVNLSNAGKESVGLQVPLNKTLVRKNFVR